MVSRATIRRTIGATIRTAGNAHAQATTKACIHLKKKPLTGPKFTKVKIPDTMNAISIDIKNANSSEAKRGGISIVNVNSQDDKLKPLIVVCYDNTLSCCFEKTFLCAEGDLTHGVARLPHEESPYQFSALGVFAYGADKAAHNE